MKHYNEDAIDEIIRDLNRIPKVIETRIDDDLVDKIADKLNRKLRRKIN